jgi:hypothetical protein
MLDQLPLQTILYFQPPTRETAITYLQKLCSELGIDTPRYADDVYERASAPAPDLLDQPLPPNGSEWLPYFDLRKAINQIQLERGVVPADQENREHDPDDLQSELRKLDNRSFEDRPWAKMEVSQSAPSE